MLNIPAVVAVVVITLVVVVAVILVAVAARTRFCKQTNIKTAATNKTRTRVASASIVRPGDGAASLLFAIPLLPAACCPPQPRTTTALCSGAARLRGGRQQQLQLQLQLSVQVRSIFNKTIKFRWNRRVSSRRKSGTRQGSMCIRSRRRRRGQRRWRNSRNSYRRRRKQRSGTAIPAVRLNRSSGYVLTAFTAPQSPQQRRIGAWSCPAPTTASQLQLPAETPSQLRQHGRRFVADCIFVLVCAE